MAALAAALTLPRLQQQQAAPHRMVRTCSHAAGAAQPHVAFAVDSARQLSPPRSRCCTLPQQLSPRSCRCSRSSSNMLCRTARCAVLTRSGSRAAIRPCRRRLGKAALAATLTLPRLQQQQAAPLHTPAAAACHCCRCLGSAALAAALRCCRLRQQVASHLTLRDAGTRLRRAAARCRSC